MNQTLNLCYLCCMARGGCCLCGKEDEEREKLELVAIKEGPRACARLAGCSHNSVMRHMDRHFAKQDLPKVEKTELKETRATPPRTPQAIQDAAFYKLKYPHIVALTVYSDRKRYLVNLFRNGRFHGLRTAGLLSMLWDDLGPIEFAELVSQAAIETNFRRGSEQARRVVLIGKVETLFRKAMAKEDIKTAARLLETWAKLDVPVNVDLMTALVSTAAWPIVARELQAKAPETLDLILGALTAEEARKRQASAPITVEASPK